ncbi:MAG: glycosyltransferase family 9 protein [Bacteroidota bacterium]|nr:glycosyltransferase family 9 protein [Bacteroidota bacterium]
MVSLNKSQEQLTELNWAVPWRHSIQPKKILAIRLQAFGDVVITLPYLQVFKDNLPRTEFHFLTREEFADIPRTLPLFEKVHIIGGGRERVKQLLSTVSLLPYLMKEHYDIVIDLQRNTLSRMIRQFLRPQSFSEFDRYSLDSAGARTKSTIDKLGFNLTSFELPRIEARNQKSAIQKFQSFGYDPTKQLIVVNPAGNFITKNWSVENYIGFANGWCEHVDANVQFAILGLNTLEEKAAVLKEKLGDKLINMVGKTTASEAFSILQHAKLVLSEDSGLMHMAWVAQVPVVALFGSTKSVWSRPLGKWSICLNSSDLECGECFQATCRFGDIHCLSRYTPQQVIDVAQRLLHEKNSTQSKLK